MAVRAVQVGGRALGPPKESCIAHTESRGALSACKRPHAVRHLLLLLLLPVIHSAGSDRLKGAEVSCERISPAGQGAVTQQRLIFGGFIAGTARSAFTTPRWIERQDLRRERWTSFCGVNSSAVCSLRPRLCTGTALWGARSNRINGKRPCVLASPSLFPAALLHLLRGGSSLPNEEYVGQHVRLPVLPSSDLSLSRAPQGPPRVFAPRPIRLHAREALQEHGLPVTRLRWPQDASLEQRQKKQQQQQEQQQQQQQVVKSNEGEKLTFESVADAGDRFPQKKTFGEEAPLFKHHLHFGSPPWPNAIVAIAKDYNKQVREAGKETEVVSEDWKCDTIFCDENGRVLRLRENADPYGGEHEPDSTPTTWELFKLRRERHKQSPPHRFIVTAPAGYVSKAGIKVGMQLPLLNDEQLATVYNNHFAQPKKFREPLILPDGTCIP